MGEVVSIRESAQRSAIREGARDALKSVLYPALDEVFAPYREIAEMAADETISDTDLGACVRLILGPER